MNASAPTFFQNQLQRPTEHAQRNMASATQQQQFHSAAGGDDNWLYERNAPIQRSPPPTMHQLIPEQNRINFVRGRETSWLNPASAMPSSSIQMVFIVVSHYL